MTKRKLISLVLAIMMLVTCVTGALFIGAKAQVQTPTEIYTVADYEEEGKLHFSNFVAAMQKAAKVSWGKDDVLEIRFQGDLVSAGPQGIDSTTTGKQGLLFSATTIWREDGTKLPITIRGIDKNYERDSSIYLDAAGGWYACANDYTFVNMTVPLAAQNTQFYAGSGNIKFVDCDLNFSGTTQLMVPTRDEFEEMAALSTHLSEHVRDTYDVDLIPVNDAAMLAAESAAFGDEELGHLLFANSMKNGLDYGDWRHEGDIGGGQYLYACVLFETLTRKSCIGNTFRPSYSLKNSDMTFEELQEIAHAAVAAEYGEGYCTEVLPDDIGADNIYNFLIIGSSNAYYCIDELASVARAAGVNMKVHHAYTSSIAFSTIASNIYNDNGDYSMQVWYDANGQGAVKSNEMNTIRLLSDILPAKAWDSVAVFETTNHLDDFGFYPGDHEVNKTKVIDNCVYKENGVAKFGIGDVYDFFKENNPNARMLWYEVGNSPIGAYGADFEHKGYLFADNCTDAVFVGWPALKEGETVKTGVTIGDGVEFVDSNVIRAAASGYLFNQNTTALSDAEAKAIKYYASGVSGAADIRPYQVKPTLTIDGEGTILQNISTKLGGAPSDATVHLKKGTVNMIYGDHSTSQSGDTEGQGEQYYGDMNVIVTGGSLRGVNMLWDGHLQGDMNLTVAPTDGEITIQKYLRGLFGSGSNPGSCTGDVTFNIQGVSLGDAIHGGGGSGKVTNILRNVSFANATGSTFIGVRCGSPASIENYFENVTMPATASHYMGAYENQVNGNIKNTFKNCTIFGNLFCGNYTRNIIGNIENSFIGGTYGGITYDDTGAKLASYNTYGGTEKSGYTVKGSITNKIKGASFQGDWFYGGNSLATFAENDSLTYRIINEIDGASFIRYSGASASTATDKIIKNTICGAQTKFTTGFYCGSNSATVNEIENHFAAKMTGYPSGGCNSGKVTTKIVTYIRDGADMEGIYAAANGGSAALVKNIFLGGKVGTFYGGSRVNTFSGSIENEIYGGTIGTFYGGSKGGTVTGTVTNTISGGDITTFYGGGESATIPTVNTTINGGAFRGSVTKGAKTSGVTTATLTFNLGTKPITFYGTTTVESLTGSGIIQVGKDASVTITGAEEGNVTVSQVEYWQDRTYLTDSTGKLTLSVADYVCGQGAVDANTVVGTYKEATFVAPVSAKLLLDTRVGVKFYFNKADITEDFTYTVLLGGQKLAEGGFADLTAEGEYYVLSFGGIGLSDFMTEFAILGETIYDANSAKYNTIVKLAELGAASCTEFRDKQLFYSIADLGRVVLNPGFAEHDLHHTAVTSRASGSAAEEGALLTFTGKNLLMNDALGIRLYGTAASAESVNGLKILVDGEDVTSVCDVSEPVLVGDRYEFTVDIFFSVSKMQNKMDFEIFDQNGKKCLTLSDQVDWVAQSIINKEPDNSLAKHVLIYIQAVDNYLNRDVSIVNPPEAGTEAELGGKVEL